MKAEGAKAIDAAAVGAIAAMRGADKPQSMSSWPFTGPDGEPVRISDFKGKTLLVNLWGDLVRAMPRGHAPALESTRWKQRKGSDRFEVRHDQD